MENFRQMFTRRMPGGNDFNADPAQWLMGLLHAGSRGVRTGLSVPLWETPAR